MVLTSFVLRIWRKFILGIQCHWGFSVRTFRHSYHDEKKMVTVVGDFAQHDSQNRHSE